MGRKRTLVIHKCTPEDGGTYICRTTDDNTSAKLIVQGNYTVTNQTKKSVSIHEAVEIKYSLNVVAAARDIKIIKKLEDAEVMEKESASFVCEISHDDVDCHWYKGSAKLKASENVKMRQEGKSLG